MEKVNWQPLIDQLDNIIWLTAAAVLYAADKALSIPGFSELALVCVARARMPNGKKASS